MKTFFLSISILGTVFAGLSAYFLRDPGYQLVWTDEFDEGIYPDENKWNVIHGNGCPENCGFGNNELQYYTNHKENVRIENGVLVIEARLDTIGTNYYTSAKLTTHNKADWRNGRIVVRAKLPDAKGSWPAIWMLPTLDRKMKWPNDGEIDIMEHVGRKNGWIFGTIHTEKYNHIIGTQKSDSIYFSDVNENFHNYSLEWDNSALRWFVDEKLFFKLERGKEGKAGWPFDQPFHLILNLAVGGNFGGSAGIDRAAFPAKFEIDYVRVYQMK